MKRTGLEFYVIGEYVTAFDWEGHTDPGDENWLPFDNADIHPFSKTFFTAWSQFDDLTDLDRAELANEIVAVINWLRHERDWYGFNATLWLHRGTESPVRIFHWELC